MHSASIEKDTNIYEMTQKWPSTIQVLVDAGFSHMRDPRQRKERGRHLTVGMVAGLRGLEPGKLLEELRGSAFAQQDADVTLQETDDLTLLPPGDIRISGLLPCPVRIPILELVREKLLELSQMDGKKIGWSLAAASVGADSLNRQIAAVQSQDDLPEIFISAGFESFFDRRNMLRFKERDVFVDLAPPGINTSFAGLDLRDPMGHFTMLGVVPAVFIINEEQLAGDPAPRTWAEILEPRFRGRVALPVGDFDLINGILLNIYERYGEDGVKALGRNMLRSLHPSQTVGRFAGKARVPAVSIIPWFFGRMTMGSRVIHEQWPLDGAIISPIFMLVRRHRLHVHAEVAEIFLSRQVGEVLSHKGRFPVLDPAVDNGLPQGASFTWLGWDFIASHDLGELIPRIDRLFKAAAQEAA